MLTLDAACRTVTVRLAMSLPYGSTAQTAALPTARCVTSPVVVLSVILFVFVVRHLIAPVAFEGWRLATVS